MNLACFAADRISVYIDTEDGVSVYGQQEQITEQTHDIALNATWPEYWRGHFELNVSERGPNPSREGFRSDSFNILFGGLGGSFNSFEIVPGIYNEVRGTDEYAKPAFQIRGWQGSINCSNDNFANLRSNITIQQYEKSVDGVLHVAIDFETTCPLTGNRLKGQIRINSDIDVASKGIIALAGADVLYAAGQPVQVVPDAILSAGRTVVSHRWRQVSGSPVAVSVDGNGTLSFVAPQDKSFQSLLFELTTTDSAGGADSDSIWVDIATEAVRRSKLRWQQEAAGFEGPSLWSLVSRPLLISVDFPNEIHSGRIVAGTNGYDSMISIALHKNDRISADTFASFQAGEGRGLLSAGMYADAQRASDSEIAKPGIEPGAMLPGCGSLEGHYYVFEVRYDTLGNLEQLAIDAVWRCRDTEYDPWQRAVMRLNSAVPMEHELPVPIIVGPSAMESGQRIHLQAIYSGLGRANDLEFKWTQVSGPALTLSEDDASVLSVLHNGLTDSDEDAVLELRATNAVGQISTERKVIRLIGKNSARNRFFHFSTVNHGGYWDLNYQNEGDFNYVLASSRLNSNNGALERFFLRADAGFLDIGFGSYPNELLQPGVYENPFSSYEAFPFLHIYSSCDPHISARFEVKELIRSSDGVITSAAIDAERACALPQPSQFYQVRLNSNVPIVRNIASAEAGPNIEVREGETVFLEGEATISTGDEVEGQSWGQEFGRPVAFGTSATGLTSIVAPPLTSAESRSRLVARYAAWSYESKAADVDYREIVVKDDGVKVFPEDFISLADERGRRFGLQYTTDMKLVEFLPDRIANVDGYALQFSSIVQLRFRQTTNFVPDIKLDFVPPEDAVWLVLRRDGLWESASWIHKTSRSEWVIDPYFSSEDVDLDGELDDEFTRVKLVLVTPSSGSSADSGGGGGVHMAWPIVVMLAFVRRRVFRT